MVNPLRTKFINVSEQLEPIGMAGGIPESKGTL
jgi:hypothetical protein